ncbi:UNVERIFIED_CONTAM: AcrR family transcriptional regulator [Streptomyces canus]
MNRTMTATTGTARDALRQEQIVQAAVVLLDEGGIENLTMRRVGSRLGITGAALYWHIKSRHELLLLAVDSVWGQAPLLCLDDLPWRAAVLAMADNLRSMCVRHPWLLTAMTIQPLDGPARDRHDRHLLAVCQTAGLTRQDAEQATQSIITFALGSALAATPGPYVSFGLQSILDGVEGGLVAHG